MNIHPTRQALTTVCPSTSTSLHKLSLNPPLSIAISEPLPHVYNSLLCVSAPSSPLSMQCPLVISDTMLSLLDPSSYPTLVICRSRPGSSFPSRPSFFLPLPNSLPSNRSTLPTQKREEEEIGGKGEERTSLCASKPSRLPTLSTHLFVTAIGIDGNKRRGKGRSKLPLESIRATRAQRRILEQTSQK